MSLLLIAIHYRINEMWKTGMRGIYYDNLIRQADILESDIDAMGYQYDKWRLRRR